MNRNPERPHIHGTQKKAAKELQPNIKVRLDRRTVIVRDSSKLAYWKENFLDWKFSKNLDAFTVLTACQARKKATSLGRLFSFAVFSVTGSLSFGGRLLFPRGKGKLLAPFLVRA